MCEHEDSTKFYICKHCKFSSYNNGTGEMCQKPAGTKGCVFECVICTDKPLTLEQLKQMDGKPVWCVSEVHKGHWNLVNTDTEKLYDKYGHVFDFRQLSAGVKVYYKAQPQPKRIVTLETAIKEGLHIKHKEESYANYLQVSNAVARRVTSGGNALTLEDLKEPVWEVQP